MTAQSQQKVDVQELTLPGWKGSDPAHWQSRWEALHGYQRVAQHDWRRPLRGDWAARLDEVIADAPRPVVLVAHSLGCVLTAWWASHSRLTHKVQGALLVAPADVEQEPLCAQLHGWSPILRQALPFRCAVLASSNDPYCSLQRAHAFAQDWGAEFQDLGPLGHINAETQLSDWPAGHSTLLRLMQRMS